MAACSRSFDGPYLRCTLCLFLQHIAPCAVEAPICAAAVVMYHSTLISELSRQTGKMRTALFNADLVHMWRSYTRYRVHPWCSLNACARMPQTPLAQAHKTRKSAAGIPACTPRRHMYVWHGIASTFLHMLYTKGPCACYIYIFMHNYVAEYVCIVCAYIIDTCAIPHNMKS